MENVMTPETLMSTIFLVTLMICVTIIITTIIKSEAKQSTIISKNSDTNDGEIICSACNHHFTFDNKDVLCEKSLEYNGFFNFGREEVKRFHVKCPQCEKKHYLYTEYE